MDATIHNTADLPDRVLIVTRELTRGGAAYLALRHARRLAGRFAVDVLVTGPCDETFRAEFPEGVGVYPIDDLPTRPEATPLRTLHQFALRYQDSAPFQRAYRAVLATSIFPDWTACAAASAVRAARRLIFLVDEGLWRFPGIGPPERGVIERCIFWADLVLPVSRRLWEKMAGRCPALRDRPWQTLRPPIDTDRILEQAREAPAAFELTTRHVFPLSPRERVAAQRPGEGRAHDQTLRPGPSPAAARRPLPGGEGNERERKRVMPVVLTVARLTPDKQIGLCLQVHHRLKQAGLRFHWYVVGSGPEEATLRAEIERLGMQEDFFILPYQENLYACMKRCDVFALLSSSEGCPTVVQEALLLGRPVVMTDVNGSDELIDHETTGLVVANDADAIAEGLSRIVGDEALRARFRAALAQGAAPNSVGSLLELVESPLPPAPTPRVSILIPTYNQERFIDQAIASALAQDYPSLEVVVCDDASTDGTGRAARAWSFDPRFRYERNDQNLGRLANYRRALNERARGDWVLMLDGDDFLADPGFIRRACSALDRHAGAGRPVVFAQAGHRVHYLGDGRRDVDILPPIGRDECVLAGGDYLRFVFETGFFTHLGTLYNRRAALELGFYTAEISSSDMDSLLRLALEGEVLVLNTIAGYWVQHGANTSSCLPVGAIVPNARVFRRVARLAVGRGLASWRQLDGPLTRYEAQTVVHLFGTTLGKSARGPLALVRLLRIGLATNPRLFREPLFLAGCLRFARARGSMFL